jgi:hypothetical protein
MAPDTTGAAIDVPDALPLLSPVGSPDFLAGGDDIDYLRHIGEIGTRIL